MERRPTAHGEVMRLEPRHTASATAVLLASHADYPSFRAVWPDPVVRRRALQPFLRSSVADSARLRVGSVGWSETRPMAVALWLPPGGFPWPLRRKVRAVPYLLRTALAGPSSFRRFARIGAAAERNHPADPHWYLEALGVRPQEQGRGWGQRVLRPGLQRADDANVACYVETADPANVPFYRRLGFEITAPALDHLPDGPPYAGMWRRPR